MEYIGRAIRYDKGVWAAERDINEREEGKSTE